MASIGLSLGGGKVGALAGAYFGPIGAAVGFVVGAAIGGITGSYVDQTLLYPAIFGKDKNVLHGPRIDDFQLSTASPGSPANLCLGRANRVPGTVIWVSPIKQVKHEESVGGGKGGGGEVVVNYEYKVSVAIAWGEGPASAVRKVWADGKPIYENLTNGLLLDDRYVDIRHYMGTVDQMPDTTVESFEGVGNTPAFRATCYTVIEDLSIGDWGNRIPSFSGLVEGEEQTLLSEAVSRILSRSGLTSTDYDTLWLQDIEVKGYTVKGPQAAQKALEPLLLAFDVVAQEESGKIVFKKRKDVVSATLTSTDLAAYEEGSDAVRRLEITQGQASELPREVDVQYIDPDLFFQRSNQRAKRINSPAPTTTSIEVPIVLSGSEAKSIAQRLMWTAWAERDLVRLSLPPSYVHLLESDVLSFTLDGAIYTLRVVEVQRGANYVHEIRTVTEEVHTLTQTATVDVPDVPAEEPPQGNEEVIFLDMETPPLRPDEDRYTRGLHWAVCLSNAGASWRGADVYVNRAPTGFTGTLFGSVTVEANVGKCLSVLPATGPVDMWDRGTELLVEMIEGELASASEEDVLNGANHLIVMRGADTECEIIAFCNAELVAPRQYKLTKLLRGVRDTVDRMSGHAVNDRFAVVDAFLRLKHYDERNHNKSDFYYRARPRGVDFNAVPTLGPYTRNSRMLHPFSPAYVRGYRDASNNLTIQWCRRTTGYFNLFDLDSAVPQLEPTEEYDLELYNTSNALVRTVRVKDSTQYTYTASQQTADIITLGPGNVKVKVYQINKNKDASGRGNVSEYVTI